MSTEPSSLTPDERALAEQLARMAPHAEPSPALDARVLAAAREAGAVPQQRRSRRWPAILGLAASLVLAVGLAWRMRPVPDAPVGRTSAPAVRMPVAPADAMQEPVAAMSGHVAEDRATATAPNVETAQLEAAAASPPSAASDAAPAAPTVRSKAAEDDSAAAFQSAPARAQSEPVPIEPPLPPPAPPAAEADSAAPQAFQRAATPEPSEPAAPSPQAVDDEAAHAATAAGDEPSLEVPPATADSPAVRDAWLQRIQALVDDGDIAGAKASLGAFVLRYPDYTLPENLRALAR